jgi:hypothetical protein
MAVDEIIQPIFRSALDRAIETVSDWDCEVTFIGGFIMASSIAEAMCLGVFDADQLVEVALQAIEDTSIH